MTSSAFRRQSLPYGIWRCADGREVLFNRAYQPIWQRSANVVEPADPGERVPWTSQEYFYDDGDVRHPRLLRYRLEGILQRFRCLGIVTRDTLYAP